MYLQRDFTHFYRLVDDCTGLIDCLCPSPEAPGTCIQEVESEMQCDTTNQISGTGGTEPMIVANDQGYAVGLHASNPTVESGVGDHDPPYYWVSRDDFGDPCNPEYAFTYRALQATFYAEDVSEGVVNYKSYWVIGDLDWVRGVLAALRAVPQIDW